MLGTAGRGWWGLGGGEGDRNSREWDSGEGESGEVTMGQESREGESGGEIEGRGVSGWDGGEGDSGDKTAGMGTAGRELAGPGWWRRRSREGTVGPGQPEALVSHHDSWKDPPDPPSALGFPAATASGFLPQARAQAGPGAGGCWGVWRCPRVCGILGGSGGPGDLGGPGGV